MIKAYYREREGSKEEEVTILGFVWRDGGLHGSTRAIIASGSLGYLHQVEISSLRVPEGWR